MEWVDVKLQSELADAARMLARERDVTVSQLLRDLVTREIDMMRTARPSEASRDRTIERLKDRLLPDFTQARSWPDLSKRLKTKGYCLVAAGGGLALHSRDTGRRVCKSSELGFGYSRLMKRMGEAFPGHPHAWLARRILPDASVGASSQTKKESVIKHSPVKDITDDFDVIEPF